MKMPFIMTLVLFTFVSTYSSAQRVLRPILTMPSYIANSTTIGHISYIITYDVTLFNLPKDNTNYKKYKAERRTTKDIQVLEIGNGVSKTYSKIIYTADSITASYHNRGVYTYPTRISRNTKNIIPFEIYKNYPEGKYSSTQRILGDTVLLSEEPYPIDFNWQLTDDKKVIESYECQKATTTFRGRTYEAWFTAEIPISDGPYKFGGLPGLILELRDGDNDYVYTCIGVKECKTVMPIKFWEWDYQIESREEANRVVKYMHDNYGELQVAARPNDRHLIMGADGTMRERSLESRKSETHPYNPIELE